MFKYLRFHFLDRVIKEDLAQVLSECFQAHHLLPGPFFHEIQIGALVLTRTLLEKIHIDCHC